MKSFLWFVLGAVAAAVGLLALSRNPKGKALMAEIEAGADEFMAAVKAEFERDRTGRER